MSRRKTREEWQSESDIIHNFEFEIIDNPSSGQDLVRVLHKKCNNIIVTRLNNNTKRYCAWCSGKKNKTKEEWQSQSDEIHNFEFEILDNVYSGVEKVRILHRKCGGISETSMINHVNNGNGCYLCYKSRKRTHSYWVENCFNIWGDEFEILQDIKRSTDKIMIKHKLCGDIIMKSMYNLVRLRRGCQNCSKKAYGEDYISKYLDKIGIKYEREKTFSGLVNITSNRKLRVDFFIEELNLVIEVDGVQHYKPIKHWGGDKSYQELISRDNIKNEFFKFNNIDLVRINNKKIKNIKEIIWQQLQRKRRNQL